MKKLVLDLDELAVQSFETQAPGETPGTVFAREETQTVCSDCNSMCTCAISDCYGCWEGPTGDYNCINSGGFQTCDLTCGGCGTAYTCASCPPC